uniref:Uncharacterized protein n=1 Tax=Nelumbo nucifera TaxID=4432 RepID=A0A822YZE5_NELNU|nr:TPA_asm: hypothetical protein HUJ06_008521 [Nelumbo nucifera]
MRYTSFCLLDTCQKKAFHSASDGACVDEMDPAAAI